MVQSAAAKRQAASRRRRKELGLQMVSTLVTKREHERIKRKARISEIPMKDWIRSVLVEAAK